MGEPQDSCVAYWKLENVNAEIGPNLTWHGTPRYLACKFNNGARGLNVDVDYLDCNGSFFTPNQWIFEKWYRPEYNIVNGVAQDGGFHMVMGWRFNISNYIRVQIHNSSGIFLRINVDGNLIDYIENTIDATTNNIYHFMWVYNQAGIAGGANRVRVYFEGNNVWSSNAAQNVQAGSNGVFYILGSRTTGAVRARCKGTEDNVKIYNNTSQAVIDAIIANKDNEEWPVAGANLIDGSLMDSGLIDNRVMIH